ncbi:MAG TPA: hypothetical protein VN025_21145 [Candidatus Dormibacteraeota bacterium]|nr:hypothetical protein [Candidatus Dormibacteraeota bacterium]
MKAKVKILGVLLLAGLGVSSARAQGANQQQVLQWIVNEPASGIDYAKLPDVEGIHLGMPVKEAIAIVNKIYRGENLQGPPNIYWVKFASGPQQPWVTYVKGALPKSDGQLGDAIMVRFSAPPNPQRVVWIQRQINFPMDKTPAASVLIQSLHEKYGVSSKGVLGTNMAWVMDEQGQPVPPTRDMACSGLTNQSAVSGSQTAPGTIPFLLGPNPFTDAELVRLSRLCKYPVNITTGLDETHPNAMIGNLVVTMTENGIDTRAAIATQKYIDNLNAAQRQQQLNKANQQAPPKL